MAFTRPGARGLSGSGQAAGRLLFGLSRIQKAILIAIAFFYIAFLTMDWITSAPGGLSDRLKYCSMLLVFTLSALAFFGAHDRRGSLTLLAALALTLVADYFLLFTRRFALGVSVFCFAQCLHALRLREKLSIPLLLITAAALIGSALLNKAYRLNAIAGLYALLFLTALTLSFTTKKEWFNHGRLRWGYILFLLCDIHVALHNTLGGAPYAQTAQKLIWLFYLPSQTLIAISGHALGRRANVNRV